MKKPYTAEDVNWRDETSRCIVEWKDETSRPEIEAIPELKDVDQSPPVCHSGLYGDRTARGRSEKTYPELDIADAKRMIV